MKTSIFLLAGLLLLTSVSTAEVQESSRKWGVGTFLAYNVPMSGLRDQFSPTSKYGLNWQYMLSSKLYFELEYHRSEFGQGKLEKVPFIWAVDKKPYLSPEAKTQMKFNGVAANLLIFHQELPAFRANDFAYYIEVGGGFYHYKAERRNFIYPAQTRAPLDPKMVLQPQIDQRAALTVNAGVGIQAFVLNNVALDLRGRYHLAMGDVRPMFAWGIEQKTFPLQLFDVGVGLKFYFWKG